ncbi:MAG: hypothetical protein ACYDH6_09380 [Acidimicrobiales bacterium]
MSDPLRGQRAGTDRDEGDDTDPWPARCEAVAAFLIGSVVCSVVGSVVAASTRPGGIGTDLGFLDRLRLAALSIGAFDGVLLVVALVLMSMEGITTGDRLGPATSWGRLALPTAAGMALIVGALNVERFIDVLAGRVNLIGPGLGGHGLYRIGAAAPQAASVILAVAAAWLAWHLMRDGWQGEATSTATLGDAGRQGEPDR